MSPEEYNQFLNALERANSDFHMMPTLREGYSILNAIYMRSTVDFVFREPSARKKSTLRKKLQPTYIRKRKLHAQRAKLSNKLVIARTNIDRARISDEILALNIEIGKLERLIRLTMREGIFVEEKDIRRLDKYADLPEEMIDLQAKLRSTRAMISMTKKALKLDKSDKLILRLRDLNEKKAEIERRISDC